MRQTYLKFNLELRARTIHSVRRFFRQNDYLEIETPYRIPAPAPEAQIDPQPAGNWYLHTSPELCMKRMLAAGFARIFQICRSFRQRERGRRHLPEFTLLEWYTAGQDYGHMMTQCERLIRHVARETGRGELLHYQGRVIDLKSPWPRMSVAEAFRRFARVGMSAAVEQGIFDEIMAVQIEPRLDPTRPLFMVDYPAEAAALARLNPTNPAVAERFELYLGGLELCNAFSELVDPREQRRRFELELRARRAAGKTDIPMPEKFLADLDRMPAATGNALGLDRLVMLLADAAEVDDVVAFVPEDL